MYSAGSAPTKNSPGFGSFQISHACDLALPEPTKWRQRVAVGLGVVRGDEGPVPPLAQSGVRQKVTSTLKPRALAASICCCTKGTAQVVS